jgi:hypothetical protein
MDNLFGIIPSGTSHVDQPENFVLNERASKKLDKWNVIEKHFAVEFRNVPENFIDTANFLSNLMEKVVVKLKSPMQSSRDLIRVFITHPSLQEPISFPFIYRDDFTSTMITDYFLKVIQSNKKLTLDEHLTFKSTIKFALRGGALGKSKLHYIANKRTIIQVRKENDKLCGLRAIVIGRAIADGLHKSTYKPEKAYQNTEALKLAHVLGINSETEINLGHIKQIERHLENYQFYLINGNAMNEFVYIGRQQTKKIYLYLNDNHYYALRSLSAFFGKTNWCDLCRKAYHAFVDHPCNTVCKKCKQRTCINRADTKFRCEFCGVLCTNDTCKINHLEKVCGLIKKCEICTHFNVYGHTCNGKWCSFCKKQVEFDHKCYILREDEKNKTDSTLGGYIFFDYEAMFDGITHVACLIIVKKICSNCLINERCNQECNTFKYFKSNKSFCEWLFCENSGYIAMAHNMKAYDGYFILQYLVENILPNEKLPSICMDGAKILSITFANVKIIDSYNFIPTALAKFPKMFGLDELKKGFFPFLFNLLISFLFTLFFLVFIVHTTTPNSTKCAAGDHAATAAATIKTHLCCPSHLLTGSPDIEIRAN